MPERSFSRLFHKPSPALVFNVLVSSLLLFVVSLHASTHTLLRVEFDVFRLINDLPSALTPELVTIMQAGTYAAVFVLAALTLLLKKWRYSIELLVAGNIAYWIARVLKTLVGRERPSLLLDNVQIRDTISGALGYPSGHVAVAMALGIITARYAPKRFHRWIWLIIILVAVARIYVGAHLPIDVIGGLLVGWLAASMTQLLIGGKSLVNSASYVQAVLKKRGFKVVNLRPLAGDARGSVPMVAKIGAGKKLFIKIISNEHRDADWLFKVYRRMFYRDIEDEVLFVSPKQKNEHEAYMSLMTERSGVRTPTLITTAVDVDGNAYLVYDFIAGKTLSSYLTGSLPQATLDDAWHQLDLLHKEHIAHRDLRAANILVKDDKTYFIDFGFAEENASQQRRAYDTVELLVGTALLFGIKQAVMAAKQALGNKQLADALPFIQTSVLSRASRQEIKKQPQLLQNIKSEVIAQTAAQQQKPVRITRISRGRIVTLLLLGLAVHFLLPRLGQARIVLSALQNANSIWLLGSLIASAATYFISAFILLYVTPQKLELRGIVGVSLASSFTNKVAPSGLSGLLLNLRYLQKQGLSAASATSVLAIIRVAGLLSTLLILPLLLLFAKNITYHPASSKVLTILLVLLGLLLAASIAVLLPTKLRGRVRSFGRDLLSSLKAYRNSGRVAGLISFSILLTVAYSLSLHFALLAVGVHITLPHTVLVYIAGSSLGAAAPTPGGIGATEAALVSGLAVIGIAPEPAIAGVLLFRLMTFWLPILPGFIAFRWLINHEVI